jgi:hypothetical protein
VGSPKGGATRSPLFSAVLRKGSAEIGSLLFIEGVTLQFTCPAPVEIATSEWLKGVGFAPLELGDSVECHFRYRADFEDELLKRTGTRQTFLVVARDIYMEYLTYHLLLLDDVDGVAQRRNVILVNVLRHQNYCINHANPQRTRLVLG